MKCHYCGVPVEDEHFIKIGSARYGLCEASACWREADTHAEAAADDDAEHRRELREDR